MKIKIKKTFDLNIKSIIMGRIISKLFQMYKFLKTLMQDLTIYYIVIVLLWTVTNIQNYCNLNKNFNEKNHAYLMKNLEIINNLLVEDIKKATLGISENFIILKLVGKSNNHTDVGFKIDKNMIFIKSINEILEFDLQNTKKTLDKVINDFINYVIVVNNNIIFSNTLLKSQDLTRTFSINKNIVLETQLQIDKNSQYYIINKRNLLQKVMLYLLVTSVVYSLIIYVLKYLMKQIKNAKIKYTNLLNHMGVISSLNNKFCVNANYLLEKNDMQIFPITFQEQEKTEIDVVKITNDLNKFYNIYDERIKLVIKVKCPKIIVKVSEITFQQIVFSVSYNIIHFMNQMSEKKKEISVTFNKECICFEYDKFLPTEHYLVRASEDLFKEKYDPFILDFARIFTLLDKCEIKHDIENKGDKDVLKIHIHKNKVEGDNVINFNTFLKARKKCVT